MSGEVLKGAQLQPHREPLCHVAVVPRAENPLWVAQRFQRCDKALLFARALAPESVLRHWRGNLPPR